MVTHFIKPKAIVLSVMLLVAGQTVAHAEPGGQVRPNLTPEQTQRLSRDLFVPYSEYFFTKGQNSFEREIQFLRQKKPSNNGNLLKIETAPQRQRDR